MSFPIQVAFHGLDHSGALETRVKEAVDGLSKFTADIQKCRVAIEMPHRHHQHGNSYSVTVQLAVPGKTIVCKEESKHAEAYLAVEQALHGAVESARRALEEWARIRRHEVKTHNPKQRNGRSEEEQIPPEADVLIEIE
jgi:ribosome-associated translation inhibitor RaiA